MPHARKLGDLEIGLAAPHLSERRGEQDLGERAKSLVSSGAHASNGSSRRSVSPQELEKRWDERARARAERAKARAK